MMTGMSILHLSDLNVAISMVKYHERKLNRLFNVRLMDWRAARNNAVNS